METKQRFITMFIALVAMFMGTKVMAQEAYAVLSDDGKTFTFRYDSSKSSYGDKAYDLNEGDNEPEWYGITSVETVVFEESFATVRPVSTCSWFDCFTNLTEIVGMEYLNTSEVTTMNSMFECCSKITNLDLSHFYTSKVTNMQDVFAGCESLKDINLHGFDTSNVTVMSRMFSGCIALETLNLGSFNTSSVTDMTMMFYGCGNLRTIYVSGGWSAPEAGSYGMFIQCGKIIGGEGTTYDDYHTAADYAHIDGGESDPGYLSATLPEAYAVYNRSSDNVSTLTFYYDNLRNTMQRVGIKKYDLNEGYNMPGWISDNRYIEKVVFDESFKDARPTSTFCWFSGNQDLDTFVGWENLNTSEVTNMSQMFQDCSGLTSVTLSGFDTQNVTNMSQMFQNCSGLTSISLSGFDTQNVTTMGHMFFGCSSLTSINLSGINTSNLVSANFMFSDCQGLTSLDLSSFDTSNVRSMNNMFSGCGNLKTITVGVNWTTDNVPVASSSNMFYGCTSLVGGAGTTYNSGKVDKEYAIADGLKGKPGYLTAVSYGIKVSGKAVTFANKYDVLGNETVNYDDDLNILTLIDADVSSINIASTAPNDLHVNVIGVCKVTSTMGNAFTTSIAKTTIEGNGKLTIVSEKGIGININRQRAAGLLVKDVDLKVAGYKAGIAGTVNSTGRTFYSSLGFDNANCIVGSLQEAAASVTAIKLLECIRCSMTAGKFDEDSHKVAANPMIIQRSSGISTDINAIDNGQLTIDKSLPLYNLNGQRVSHPVKGQIYIQNGRKIKF
jgi:surface protein